MNSERITYALQRLISAYLLDNVLSVEQVEDQEKVKLRQEIDIECSDADNEINSLFVALDSHGYEVEFFDEDNLIKEYFISRRVSNETLH